MLLDAVSWKRMRMLRKNLPPRAFAARDSKIIGQLMFCRAKLWPNWYPRKALRRLP
jgi:hypothetical protein